MKVCVQGLWHLGSVTAAALSFLGHEVIGFDREESIIRSLSSGKCPISEFGVDNYLSEGISNGNLSFTSDYEVLKSKDIHTLWVCYDTPVNDNDEADCGFVINNIIETIPFLSSNIQIIISSQLPIGSIKKLEDLCAVLFKDKSINFVCSPENLRLGSALNVFLHPDRIVVGVRNIQCKNKVSDLFNSISSNIEWMSVESAEMTKHAINSFLATSVVFANEIASICELNGADAKEVERGLKTDQRIGQKAYLSPGKAFSGGTLARDVEFLKTKAVGIDVPLINSIKESNDYHKSWTERKIISLFDDLACLKIAVWGITYKSGTDTLRRSLPVEMCDWLISRGSHLNIYDPAVKILPDRWDSKVSHFQDPILSLSNVDVLLIGTEYKEFKSILKDYVNTQLTVIDSNRLLPFLQNSVGRYVSVGSPK